MTLTSNDKCPYCGKEYPTITIPPFAGSRAYTVQSRVCDCDGAVEAERTAARKLRQHDLKEAWHKTGVPRIFQPVTPDFDGLGQLEFAGGLYIFGPKGTGKTTRACSILKAYVSRNQRDGWVSAKFISVPDWLASMRGNWGHEEEDAFQRAAGCKLLVLDDLGKGKPTEWAMERLFRLIDRRYNDMRPTIYTSQHSLDQLGGKCATNGDVETAEAIVSRIYATCEAIEYSGADLRKI